MIEKHLNWLGLPARDRVTGFTGVVTSISFDLYGCVQAIVTPKASDDGKIEDSHWFDVKRLQTTGERVMDVPPFVTTPVGQEAGPEAKPALCSQPLP